MKILFAASECIPFIKTGGLADVVGTLPKAIAAAGHDVRVILPKHRRIPESFRFAMTHVFDTRIALGWRSQYLGVDSLLIDGVTYYFVDNEYYFGQDYVYGSGDFESERFCFFCTAVLETLPHIGFFPDILHCNDWQTGFIPMLISTQYKILPDYRKIKTVFTIHNLRFQGVCPQSLVGDVLSVGQDALSSIEYGGGASAMKAAILYADRITTVSPTYAKEILTKEYGETLDGVLRERANDMSGILNCIDNSLLNPWTDKAIECRYSKNNPYGTNGDGGKLRCRERLISEMGFADSSLPVVAVISRLTDQKGVDLIADALPKLMASGVSMVVLGMGDKRYESLFSLCQEKYAGRFAFRMEMNDALARRIYAGADIFLMPSAFEPCGLSQLMALRYGCVPVVRETGGLADTVQAYNKYDDTGNGFSFANYSADEMLAVTQMALELYKTDRAAWLRLVRRAMACDNGWAASAAKYIQLYEVLIHG